MYKKPQASPLSHYLRTGQKADGFHPDSYADHDLCDLCGGTVYDLDIKGVRNERNSRYQALFIRYNSAKRAGKTHKVWQMKGGFETRLSHKRANGQKVGIDEKFRVGGEELFLPNDPTASLNETANCRCIVRYIKEYNSIQSLGSAKLNIIGADAVTYVDTELSRAENNRGQWVRQNRQLGVAVNKHGSWTDAHPYILEEDVDTGAGIRGDKAPIDKNTKLIVIGLPRKDSLDLIFREYYASRIKRLVRNHNVTVVVFKVGPDNRQFIFRPPAGSEPVLWKPTKRK